MRGFLHRLLFRYSGGLIRTPQQADLVICLVVVFIVAACIIYLSVVVTCTLCTVPADRSAQAHLHPELYVKNIKKITNPN